MTVTIYIYIIIVLCLGANDYMLFRFVIKNTQVNYKTELHVRTPPPRPPTPKIHKAYVIQR